MEILDAEYQLDYKKLTFFYYADCYINFNHLVTDLFKIYKARIWIGWIESLSLKNASQEIAQRYINFEILERREKKRSGGQRGRSSHHHIENKDCENAWRKVVQLREDMTLLNGNYSDHQLKLIKEYGPHEDQLGS
ncbi:hypothetical protein HDK77DRAFT_481324 [Phyllosticta capitalensis]